MGTTMNSDAYKKIIEEDLEWLDKQPRTLEREHIRKIVEHSIILYYPHLAENLSIHSVVGQSEQLVCINCNKTKSQHSTASFLCDGRLSHFEVK